MKVVFFSDVHLLQNDAGGTKRLETFFRDVMRGVDQVFIIGDLFEFYHGYDDYIFPWYQPAADALKKLTETGVKIFFLEGNHEFGMGTYFAKHTGVMCRQEMAFKLDGKEVYITHGDRSDLFCLGTFLKSRLIYSIMDKLGPEATWKCSQIAGRFISRKEKKYSAKTRNAFRDKAYRKINEGYDVVIFAHSHMADMADLGIRGVKPGIYLNTGDFGRYGDYVLYESGKGFSLRRYKGVTKTPSIKSMGKK